MSSPAEDGLGPDRRSVEAFRSTGELCTCWIGQPVGRLVPVLDTLEGDEQAMTGDHRCRCLGERGLGLTPRTLKEWLGGVNIDNELLAQVIDQKHDVEVLASLRGMETRQ